MKHYQFKDKIYTSFEDVMKAAEKHLENVIWSNQSIINVYDEKNEIHITEVEVQS